MVRWRGITYDLRVANQANIEIQKSKVNIDIQNLSFEIQRCELKTNVTSVNSKV